MDKAQQAVAVRARQIFERLTSANEVWGDSAARQTHTFPDPTNPTSLTQTVIGDEFRARYLVLAREELKAESQQQLARG